MNWDQVKTNWPQMKTNLKQSFDKLTDDDITNIKENFRDRLVDRIMNRYGYTKDVAQQKLDEFITNLKTPAKV